MEWVPPIVRARFGLEQRCAYRHADLYDEEVPEAGQNAWQNAWQNASGMRPFSTLSQVDLETVIAQPELGAECAVKSFVLLGDQNAGKSTMLHRC